MLLASRTDRHDGEDGKGITTHDVLVQQKDLPSSPLLNQTTPDFVMTILRAGRGKERRWQVRPGCRAGMGKCCFVVRDYSETHAFHPRIAA